jgi:hypothetical protein
MILRSIGAQTFALNPLTIQPTIEAVISSKRGGKKISVSVGGAECGSVWVPHSLPRRPTPGSPPPRFKPTSRFIAVSISPNRRSDRITISVASICMRQAVFQQIVGRASEKTNCPAVFGKI